MPIAISTQYNPFSYDELVKPYLYHKQAYDETSKDYENLAMQADAYRDIINQDPELAKTYEEFNNNLNSAVDELSSGYINKKRLLYTKKKFAQDIVPMIKASEAFDKNFETRQNMQMKDPSIRFYNQYNSIRDFMGGNKPDNSFISGKDVRARVAEKAERLAQTKLSDPKFLNTKEGKNFASAIMAGYSPEELNEILVGSSQADPMFRSMIENELSAIGYDKLSDEDKNYMYNEIMTGAYSGLSKANINYMNARNSSAASNLAYQKYLDSKDKEAKEEAIRMGKAPAAMDADGNPIYITAANDTWKIYPSKGYTPSENYQGEDKILGYTFFDPEKGQLVQGDEEQYKKAKEKVKAASTEAGNDSLINAFNAGTSTIMRTPTEKLIKNPKQNTQKATKDTRPYIDAMYGSAKKEDTRDGISWEENGRMKGKPSDYTLIMSKGDVVENTTGRSLSQRALNEIEERIPKTTKDGGASKYTLSDVDVYVDKNGNYVVVDARKDITGKLKEDTSKNSPSKQNNKPAFSQKDIDTFIKMSGLDLNLYHPDTSVILSILNNE